MEQRDYLEKQLAEMGRFFAQLASMLAGRVSSDAKEALEQQVAPALVDKLGMAPGQLAALDIAGFKEMMDKLALLPADADALAELLQAMGSIAEERAFIEKALAAYQYASEKDESFSFKRQGAIKRLQEQLG